jgi:hypothetical protein
MVIKGGSRAGAVDLAKHLQRVDTNERMVVRELDGVVAGNLDDALREMEAVAAGARSRKPFYHASINTPRNEALTEDQKTVAIERLETSLGLTGQPRVVVEHVKMGRAHLHIAWSRIDGETLKAIPDGHNYRKHEEVARALEREFGHQRVQGAHHERDGVERPARRPSHGETRQAERSGITPEEAKAQLRALWESADTGKAFAAALDDAGWVLAQGDKRGFVALDPTGEVRAVNKDITGLSAAKVRERLADLDADRLPDVDEARAHLRDRRRDLGTEQAVSRGMEGAGESSEAIQPPSCEAEFQSSPPESVSEPALQVEAAQVGQAPEPILSPDHPRDPVADRAIWAAQLRGLDTDEAAQHRSQEAYRAARGDRVDVTEPEAAQRSEIPPRDPAADRAAWAETLRSTAPEPELLVETLDRLRVLADRLEAAFDQHRGAYAERLRDAAYRARPESRHEAEAAPATNVPPKAPEAAQAPKGTVPAPDRMPEPEARTWTRAAIGAAREMLHQLGDRLERAMRLVLEMAPKKAAADADTGTPPAEASAAAKRPLPEAPVQAPPPMRTREPVRPIVPTMPPPTPMAPKRERSVADEMLDEAKQRQKPQASGGSGQRNRDLLNELLPKNDPRRWHHTPRR